MTPLGIRVLKKPCFCYASVKRKMLSLDALTLKISALLPNCFDSVVPTFFKKKFPPVLGGIICQLSILGTGFVYKDEINLPLNDSIGRLFYFSAI